MTAARTDPVPKAALSWSRPELRLSNNDRRGVGEFVLEHSTLGDVPAAVEFGWVAAAPVNTLRQQTHRCQEISVCF